MPNAQEIRSLVYEALEQGKLEQAIPWANDLLGNGTDAASLVALGSIYAASGDMSAALAYTGEATRLEPFTSDALTQRGNFFALIGEHAAAAETFSELQLFMPLDDQVLSAILINAERAGRPQIALSAIKRRIRLGGETAELQNSVGLLSHVAGDLRAAQTAYHRAIALAPNTPLYYSNLATIYYHLERYDDALSYLERALQIEPDFPIALYHVGNVRNAMRALPEAEAAYRRAISAAPEYAEAHFALGCTLLQQDAWAEGWKEYEWRWNVPGLVAPINADVPRWQGEDLKRKRIMVVAEQGAGDTLQYIRYAEELVSLGAEVVIWAPPEIRNLLRRIPYVKHAATNRFELPACDYYIPTMSLPRILQKSIYDISAASYLTADATRKAKFSRELGARKKQLRLGLAWAGNPGQVADRYRSAELRALAPLFENPDIRWISLQKGEAARQIAESGFAMEDWSDKLDDYDATAAAMAALDGVVSVCSSPIHLAGALGIRSVAMLAWAADWRWRNDDETTPYYENMTVARMNSFNDWHELAGRVAGIVAEWEPLTA